MGRVETIAKASCSSSSSRHFYLLVLLLLHIQCSTGSTFSLKPYHHQESEEGDPWAWSSVDDDNDDISASHNFDDAHNYDNILADRNEGHKWHDSYFDELFARPSKNNGDEEKENSEFMEDPEPLDKSTTQTSSSSSGSYGIRNRKRKWHAIDATSEDVSLLPTLFPKQSDMEMLRGEGEHDHDHHAHELDAVDMTKTRSSSSWKHATRPRTRFTFPNKKSVSVPVSNSAGHNGAMDSAGILMKMKMKPKQARNQSGAKEKSFLFPYRIPFPYVRSRNNEDAKAGRNSNEGRKTGQRRIRIRVRRESGIEVNSPTSSTEVDKQNKSYGVGEEERVLVQETQVKNVSGPNAPLPFPPHHHPSSNPIEIMERLNRLLQRMLRELSQFGQKFTLRLIRMTERQDIDQMQEIMKDFEISPEKPIFFIAGGLRLFNSTRKNNVEAVASADTRENTNLEMLENATTTTTTVPTTTVSSSPHVNDTSLDARENETMVAQEISSVGTGSTITPILQPQSEPDPDFDTTTSLPVESSTDDDDSDGNGEGTTPGSVEELNVTESHSQNILREPPQRLNRSSRSIPEFDEFDFLPIPGRSARTENPYGEDEDFDEDVDDDDDDEDHDDDDDHHHRRHHKTKIVGNEVTATVSSGERVVDQVATKVSSLSGPNVETSELQMRQPKPNHVLEEKVVVPTEKNSIPFVVPSSSKPLAGGNDQSVTMADVTIPLLKNTSAIVEDGAGERVVLADESSSISLRKSSPSHISPDVTTLEGINVGKEANVNLNLGLQPSDEKDTLQANSQASNVDIAGDLQDVLRDNIIGLPLEKSAGGSEGNDDMISIQQRSFDGASSSSSFGSSANALERGEDERKLDADSRRNSVVSGSSEVGGGLPSTLNAEVVTPSSSSSTENVPGSPIDETRVVETEKINAAAPSSVHSIRDTVVTDLTDAINPKEEIKVVQTSELHPTPIPIGIVQDKILVSPNSDTVPYPEQQETTRVVVSPIVSVENSEAVGIKEMPEPEQVHSSTAGENSEELVGGIGETGKVFREEEMKAEQVLKVQESLPLKESQIMGSNAANDDKMPAVIPFPPEKTETISPSDLTTSVGNTVNVIPIANQDVSLQEKLAAEENGSIVPGSIEGIREVEPNSPVLVLTQPEIEKEDEKKNVDGIGSPVVTSSDRTIGGVSSSGDILTSASENRQVHEDTVPIDLIPNGNVSQSSENVKIIPAIEPRPEINVPVIDLVKNVREVEENAAAVNVDKQTVSDGHVNTAQEAIEPAKVVTEPSVKVDPISVVPAEIVKVVPVVNVPVESAVEVVKEAVVPQITPVVIGEVKPVSSVEVTPPKVESVKVDPVANVPVDSTVEVVKEAEVPQIVPVNIAEVKPVSTVDVATTKVESVLTNVPLEVGKPEEVPVPLVPKVVADPEIVAPNTPDVKPLVVDLPAEVKPVTPEEKIQPVAEIPVENVDEKIVLIPKVAILSKPAPAIVEPILLDSKIEAVKTPVVDEVVTEPLVTETEAVKIPPIIPVEPVIEPVPVPDPAPVLPVEVKAPATIPVISKIAVVNEPITQISSEPLAIEELKPVENKIESVPIQSNIELVEPVKVENIQPSAEVPVKNIDETIALVPKVAILSKPATAIVEPISIDSSIEAVKTPANEVASDLPVTETEAVKITPILPIEPVIEPIPDPAPVQPVEVKPTETVPLISEVAVVKEPVPEISSEPLVVEKLKPNPVESEIEPVPVQSNIELVEPTKEEFPSSLELEQAPVPLDSKIEVVPTPIITKAVNPPLVPTIPEVLQENHLKTPELVSEVVSAPVALPEPVQVEETIVKNNEETVPLIPNNEVVPIYTPETSPVSSSSVPLVTPDVSLVAPVSLPEPAPVDDSIIISNIPQANPDSHFGVKPIDTLPHLQIPGINRPSIPDRPHPDDYLAFILKDMDSTPPLYFAPAPSPIIVSSPHVQSTYSPEAILRKQQILMKNYFSGFYRRAIQA